MNKYIFINFYLKNKNPINRKILIHFKYKFYLINSLKVNILININILKHKHIIIDIKKQQIIFQSCFNIKVLFKLFTKNNTCLYHIIKTKKAILIFFSKNSFYIYVNKQKNSIPIIRFPF